LKSVQTSRSRSAKAKLGLHQPKEMTGGCFQDYGARHYPFKTLNRRLNVVLGCPKGANLLKRLGQLKVVF